MARSPTALPVDTDIFIDYLNGIEWTREILDSSRYRVYYSTVTRKELLTKPGLSSTERHQIRILLLRHRLILVDEKIAERFSRLLQKYNHHGLRKADALIAATACSRKLPLLTRNIRHYRFISEITLIEYSQLNP